MEDWERFPVAVGELIQKNLFHAALNELGHTEREPVEVDYGGGGSDNGMWVATVKYRGLSESRARMSKKDAVNMAAWALLENLHRQRATQLASTSSAASNGTSVLDRLAALERRVAQLEALLGK